MMMMQQKTLSRGLRLIQLGQQSLPLAVPGQQSLPLAVPDQQSLPRAVLWTCHWVHFMCLAPGKHKEEPIVVLIMSR